jgi:hypothetical protein
MRYSLRTLLILMAVVPPVLAVAWLAAVWCYRKDAEVSAILAIWACVLFIPVIVGATIGAIVKRRMMAEFFRLKKEDAERRAGMKDEPTPSQPAAATPSDA